MAVLEAILLETRTAQLWFVLASLGLARRGGSRGAMNCRWVMRKRLETKTNWIFSAKLPLG